MQSVLIIISCFICKVSCPLSGPRRFSRNSPRPQQLSPSWRAGGVGLASRVCSVYDPCRYTVDLCNIQGFVADLGGSI